MKIQGNVLILADSFPSMPVACSVGRDSESKFSLAELLRKKNAFRICLEIV